jgi:WhiB family redox-sensing transcriptional regulator
LSDRKEPAILEDPSELDGLLPWLIYNEASHSDPVLELARFLVRPAWHARAACRGMGTRAFFPQHGETAAEARAICSSSPVREQCLAAAFDERGIWAGSTEGERAKMRRAASAAVAA